MLSVGISGRLNNPDPVMRDTVRSAVHERDDDAVHHQQEDATAAAVQGAGGSAAEVPAAAAKTTSRAPTRPRPDTPAQGSRTATNTPQVNSSRYSRFAFCELPLDAQERLAQFYYAQFRQQLEAALVASAELCGVKLWTASHFKAPKNSSRKMCAK